MLVIETVITIILSIQSFFVDLVQVEKVLLEHTVQVKNSILLG